MLWTVSERNASGVSILAKNSRRPPRSGRDKSAPVIPLSSTMKPKGNAVKMQLQFPLIRVEPRVNAHSSLYSLMYHHTVKRRVFLFHRKDVVTEKQ